jgi:hypothetical protein
LRLFKETIRKMGGLLAAMERLNVFHECIYYVLNDFSFHSDCQEYCTMDCETHQVVEEAPDYAIQTSCCFIKDADSETSGSREGADG